MTTNKSEISACNKVTKLAKAMLDGDLSFLEGAAQISILRAKIKGITADDSDFNTFIGIASESDHLPLKEQRMLWNREVLKQLVPEFTRLEEWASSFAPQACKNLIARFK